MLPIFKTILIIDITIFSSLILFYIIKPDEINPILGYRTKRAMKNQKNWKFAQSFFSKNWLYTIPIMIITQIPILIDNSLDIVVPFSFVNFILFSVYLIFVTEKKLKKLDQDEQK